MGRGKIEIKRIESTTKRQVTFSKRRSGLFKKTQELSILCDAQIALIVFSSTGKLFQFASFPSTMEQIIERYQTVQGVVIPQHNDQEAMLREVQQMRALVHETQMSLQSFLGEDLIHSYGHEDLYKREQLLESSLDKIRARKNQLIQQQLENLHKSGNKLEVENNYYHWLRGNGQYNEQQVIPIYGGEELGSMLQLSTLPAEQLPPPPQQLYPYLSEIGQSSTHPDLRDLNLCTPGQLQNMWPDRL